MVSGFIARSIANLTSAAVNGRPLWKRTPFLRWRVNVRLSGVSHRSASPGTSAPVRSTFTRSGGNLGEPGSVGYLFSQKGLIEVKGDEDEIMLTALDAGAEDVRDSGDGWFEVVTSPGDLPQVRNALVAADFEIGAADVTQLPSSTVPVAENEARRLLRLIDALDDLDDVQAVFSNYDIDDDVMERALEEV